MLVLTLGWRNLWRNPRRSLINVSAVATALVFLVLLQGMMEGMKDQLLENGTALMSGHLQLHHPDYLPDRNIYDTLGGEEGVSIDLMTRLGGEEPAIEAASARVYGFALLSTGEHSAGARLMGIQPGSEERVTTFLQGIESGDVLAQDSAGKLLLGEGLAKELRATIGSEVAAMTQAADGSLGNALFDVAGVVRTGLAHVDKNLAVVGIRDLQQLMALDESRFHEVAVRLTSPQLADQVTETLNQRVMPPKVLAQSWGDLSPQLRDYLSLFGGTYVFLIGFVAVFAALGILNTMMMAVFERTREIGTVVSLGMSPAAIVWTILLESFFSTVLGLIAGVILSGLLMQPLISDGLDLSRWMGELAMMNTRMDPVIKFKWVWDFVGWSAIALILAGLLAAAVPAGRAARMNPVKARNSAAEV